MFYILIAVFAFWILFVVWSLVPCVWNIETMGQKFSKHMLAIGEYCKIEFNEVLQAMCHILNFVCFEVLSVEL